MALRYAGGDLNPLNTAEQRFWPEPTVTEVYRPNFAEMRHWKQATGCPYSSKRSGRRNRNGCSRR
ncbi:hypothetical protein, partial [Endothiovibrio diazotrophicus]